MTQFIINSVLVVLFFYLCSRQPAEETVYDEEFFLQNPSAIEEYQQMPLDFQHAFFRKHKEWIKEKYMHGDSYLLGYCPNKDVRRAWLSEFLQSKNFDNVTPS
ncbi:hypothetical protein EDM56_13315 [Brevibacillus fluminis]|uniref:Uncharacterized protein n=1 Tax=Brevibacillus fluminis TaxID=511487 RepID=A0A3M8DI74_9BACL|nr:hypothetical protein [Brevibacillus fluminis]RNB87803.1 hypothetical protein EDM56_13315 [Brevibacillus fluminis]